MRACAQEARAALRRAEAERGALEECLGATGGAAGRPPPAPVQPAPVTPQPHRAAPNPPHPTSGARPSP